VLIGAVTYELRNALDSAGVLDFHRHMHDSKVVGGHRLVMVGLFWLIGDHGDHRDVDVGTDRPGVQVGGLEMVVVEAMTAANRAMEPKASPETISTTIVTAVTMKVRRSPTRVRS